jgi:hypothetical protein
MALLTLAAFSAVAGVLILWAFKVCSNQRALKATRRRVRGYLLAVRLFADDPLLILRSQGRLLAWNGRYLALLLPSFLVVAIPLFFAWDYLDAVWGRAPLAPGDTVVVTARLRADVAGVKLAAPAWLAVETPGVRVPAEREVSWRVRVLQAGSGNVSVRAGAERAEKRIEANPGLHYLPDRTSVSGTGIEWVEVRYPRADLSALGVSFNWVVWFCLISTVTALALRRKLRVTF